MPASGTTIGTVIRWDDARGTGLVEAPDLPGECWVDAAVVAHSTGSGGLRAGQVVEVTWTTEGTVADEGAGTRRLRAVRVRPREDLQTGFGG
jgi:CspA family cold shock protein